MESKACRITMHLLRTLFIDQNILYPFYSTFKSLMFRSFQWFHLLLYWMFLSSTTVPFVSLLWFDLFLVSVGTMDYLVGGWYVFCSFQASTFCDIKLRTFGSLIMNKCVSSKSSIMNRCYGTSTVLLIDTMEMQEIDQASKLPGNWFRWDAAGIAL